MNKAMRLEDYLEGGGVNGYDALRHESILRGDAGKPVSYTHLTLPTIYSV